MPSPDERDREHLGRRDRGEEREHRAVGHRDAERVDRAVDRDEHRRLVRDRGDQHPHALGGLAPDAVDADVHRADEAHPVLALGEATGEVRAAGDDEDHDQGDDGGAGDDERDPRVVETEQRRLEREAEEREQRERDETAEPLDDHRRERDVAGAGGLRGAADAQDVAADRRRQHVADELPGEVVRRAACAAARGRRTPRAPVASATPRARTRRG